MDRLTDLQKDKICEKINILTDDMNDTELEYAISVMQFWLNERKRQDEELKELYGELY